MNGLLIILGAALVVSCSSMKATFEEFSKDHADSKVELNIEKNYQKLFSDMAQALETCEQKNTMGNDFRIHSEMHADKGLGDISMSNKNFMYEARWAWARLYKNGNRTKVVIYGASNWKGVLAKYAKGEYERKCLQN